MKIKVKLTKKLMDYPHDCELYENGATVTNPFSEEQCYLPADALSVYDVIKEVRRKENMTPHSLTV